MSFREYLAFRFTENFDRLELNQITGGEHKFVLDIENRLKSHNIPILAAFEDYLQQGCYPYFLDSPQHYGARLARTIENIIAGDIATALDLNAESIHKLNRLYAMIASSKPFTPNIASLAKDLAATRDTIYRYFSYLEKAGLTRSLRRSASKAGHILTKPDKVCLSNPNLIFISRDPRLHSEWRGSLRESFFVSNFKADEIFLADSGDFIVDDLTFEIGGPGKTGKQVKGIKNAYVVRDGEQFASGHFLPLWIFGFIY